MGYIGTKPANQIVSGSQITDGTIVTADLADNAVTSLKIANSAITTEKIALGAVITEDLADNAVTNTKIANGTIALAKLATSGTPSSGNFLRGDGSWQGVSVATNIQQSSSSSMQTFSSGSWFDITGVNVSITPSATSSRVLVKVSMNGSAADNAAVTFRLLRDGVEIFGSSGTRAGFRTLGMDSFIRTGIFNLDFEILDSPATTNTVNYKVQGYGVGAWYINRNSGLGATNGYGGTSALILTEIRA